MAQLLYQQKRGRLVDARNAGWAILAIILVTAAVNGVWTLRYVFHPEYTWVTAAQNMTQYIDRHPSGKRLLVSISGAKSPWSPTCPHSATTSAPRSA